MANIKVSEMATATTFEDDDYTMIVQSNKNKKITRANILGGIESDISDLDTSVTQNTTKINNLNTYSTNEVEIGTWVDNKPIYRKCIYVSAFPNNSTTEINISSLIIDYIVNLYGYAKNKSVNGSGFPVNNARPENTSAPIGAWLDNNVLKIASNNDRSNFNGYIILEYTKTTD